MTPRQFLLTRLREEDILVAWADAVFARVVAGLGLLEVRQLAGLWEGHPDYRSVWKP